MVLVYIENYSFLTKIVYYLKRAGFNYTTDMNLSYDYILIAEINSKTKKLIEEHPDKNFIFITHLEEAKIYNYFNSTSKRSNMYKNKYRKFFNKCYKLIVSLPYFKNLLKNYCMKIDVIPNEIPIVNISRNTRDIYYKYTLSKRKKKIIIIDLYYKNLNYIYELATRYSKYEFIYIGYASNYLLPKKDRDILYKLPSNIVLISYINEYIFSDLCKVSYMVIDFDSYLLGINYLYISLILKKYLIVYDNLLYKDLFVPSKHCYYFENKNELFLRVDKIINNRVMNLSDVGYDLIKSFTLEEVLKKYRETL